MFAIIGIIIVFGSVAAGYREHSCAAGAAVGNLLVANPLHIIKKIAAGIGGVFGSSKFG